MCKNIRRNYYKLDYMPLYAHLIIKKNFKKIMQTITNETIIAKETFAPVVKTFDRKKKLPHYTDECWSINLIDPSNLGKNKNFIFLFTIVDIYTNSAWTIHLSDKSG